MLYVYYQAQGGLSVARRRMDNYTHAHMSVRTFKELQVKFVMKSFQSDNSTVSKLGAL